MQQALNFLQNFYKVAACCEVAAIACRQWLYSVLYSFLIFVTS